MDKNKIRRTFTPMHPVPHLIERDYDRYNYDLPCIVKDHMSTELYYDPKHTEKIDGDEVAGWWVYKVCHRYLYIPTSGVHTPEYILKLSRLPQTTEEIMLCPYDVYVEDAMKRRGEI